jgi:hypothetical protein
VTEGDKQNYHNRLNVKDDFCCLGTLKEDASKKHKIGDE